MHIRRNLQRGVPQIAGTLFLFLVLVSLSGCKTGLAVVTATPPPTAITVNPPTLPPSWTPGPSPTAIPATNTPAITFQAAQGSVALSALPPTWTPAPIRTDTPVPIVTATEDYYRLTLTALLPLGAPTINPTTPAPPTQAGTAQPPQSPLVATFPPYCSGFAVNTAVTTRTLILGNDATVAWKLIREANAYHLWLATADGFYRFNTTVTGDRAIIPAKQFLTVGIYGYELVAYIDANPICGHETGIIIVKTG